MENLTEEKKEEGNKAISEILTTLKTRKGVGKVKDGVNLVDIVEKLTAKRESKRIKK